MPGPDGGRGVEAVTPRRRLDRVETVALVSALAAIVLLLAVVGGIAYSVATGGWAS